MVVLLTIHETEEEHLESVRIVDGHSSSKHHILFTLFRGNST